MRMQINNIGHLSAPAERPFSDGVRGQGALEYVARVAREICEDLDVTYEEFVSGRRGNNAMKARHRCCVIALEVLRPEFGILEISKFLGIRHTTLLSCNGTWRRYEGAE
mgnify:FL=1